jgi:hypothetical protein
LLDYIIALNETHLLRFLREYVAHHHGDRVHDSLGKDCPIFEASNTDPTIRRRSPAAHVSADFTTDTSGVLPPDSSLQCFPPLIADEARARHVYTFRPMRSHLWRRKT